MGEEAMNLEILLNVLENVRECPWKRKLVGTFGIGLFATLAACAYQFGYASEEDAVDGNVVEEIDETHTMMIDEAKEIVQDIPEEI